MSELRRRVSYASLVGVAAVVISAVFPVAWAAAAVGRPTGHVDGVSQNAQGVVRVNGWVLDHSRPSVSSTVDIVVNGRPAARITAPLPRGDVNRALRITGKHGFSWSAKLGRAQVVTVYARPAIPDGSHRLIATAYLNGAKPPAAASAGVRIITQAKAFLGTHNPGYVHGGTSPLTGFDCSGYTQYVYRQTRVTSLPRTAEQQRHAVRLIPRSQARPGDLVFYLSGGSAYHIAIYAGNGMQYAAATTRDGIKYQGVWSAAVQYGTTWH
jgi:cell wall-associated NlpC family hydrolase